MEVRELGEGVWLPLGGSLSLLLILFADLALVVQVSG